MDKVINIKVRNRIAIADPSERIVCGNEDYTAVFDFDDEWSGIGVKTARFYRGGIYTDTVFTGDTVVIPEMSKVSYVEIGVFAGDITTTPAVVRCYRSILCNGGNVSEPEDDVYAQIIELINSIEGSTGPAGADGVSPTVSVEQITGGNRIAITDVNGKKTFDVLNGSAGATPAKGTDYWTAEDQMQIVNDVLAALPAAEEAKF